MKKYLNNFIFILILIAFSCEDVKESKVISSVPSSFTKKVLIEEFTGAWCQFCPDGAYILGNIINANNENVIGVSIHSGDDMEIEHTNFLINTYQNTGFPSGMVDRVVATTDYYGNSIVSMNRGWWDYIATIQLEKIASCGLAMKSDVSNGNAEIDVHVGFNEQIQGDIRLNVYLIEDNVTGTGYGFDQRNFYNTDTSSIFFGLGDPIQGYAHNHTLRLVLTESQGNLISSEAIASGEHTETFKISIEEFDKNELSIVAFVNNLGASFAEHEVLNAKKCSIEGFEDWD